MCGEPTQPSMERFISLLVPQMEAMAYHLAWRSAMACTAGAVTHKMEMEADSEGGKAGGPHGDAGYSQWAALQFLKISHAAQREGEQTTGKPTPILLDLCLVFQRQTSC